MSTLAALRQLYQNGCTTEYLGNRRPPLKPAPKMDQAVKGASVQPLGRAIFKLQLGTWTGKRLITVVRISDDALLGDDILRLDITGPGDILYTENVLKFAGQRIPLRTVGTCGDAPRVVCLQDEIIPGMSEKVVDAFLERPQGEEIEGEDSMIVEPDMGFCERYGCLVTLVLVDTCNQVTTQIHLLNPFPDPIKIHAEVVMGHLEPGIVKWVVQEREYAGEDNNNLDCRRLTLATNTNKTNKEKSRTSTTGQPEPCRANDVRSLPDQGWLGQGGLRRLQSGLKDAAGQFTTCGRGDKEVLPSQQGGLGQGQLSKPDVVIGHSVYLLVVEPTICGCSGVESTTCLSIGHSGIEPTICGCSDIESTTCLSIGCSDVESTICGCSGVEPTTCGCSGIEPTTCGHSGAEPMTCSVDGQSGAESLTCPTKEDGVDVQGLAKVRARRGNQQVPVRATCIAGSRRVPKRKMTQRRRDAKSKKVCRVKDPALEVEAAGGTPEVKTAEGATEDGNGVQDVAAMEEPDEPNEEPGEVPAHVAELVERCLKGWSHSQQKAIRKLLIKHADIFSKDEFDIGSTDLVEHEIDTGDAKPMRSAPRPMAYGLKEGGKVTISKLLERGIIEQSCSPWASPVTLVAKKDGTVRLTIDYRRLNAVTKVPASTIPKVQDCVDALEGSTIFSLLDSGSAYYQIKMKKDDIPKTAFISQLGHFHFLRMPMGLSNAPQAFTRLMELALAGLQWTTCVIYLDDVIVFGKTFDEHLNRLDEVLNRFRDAGLKLKPKKCEFFQKEVQFLGYMVSQEGLRPLPDNLEKVKSWAIPQDVTDIHAIIGLGNYYRWFIKDYSEKVRPLVELTKKDVQFVWGKKEQDSFDNLREALLGAGIMSHPQENGGTFILDTDASGTTIGCVLSQEQDGKERVIAYGSKALSRQEHNYCVTDRELLAV